MNREILFRGQTRKRGEKVRMDGTPVDGNWVYGGILQGTGDYSIIYGSADPDKISVSNIEKHVVHTDTVGQYTGLTDKNGVKIFEGDIVRYNSGEFDVHAAVKVGEYEQDGSGGEYGPTKCVGVYLETIGFTRPDWAEELGANPPDYETTVSPLDRAVDGAEVIGNIHDSPELMGGEDDG